MDSLEVAHPMGVPEGLRWGRVRLAFSEFVPAGEALELAPRYIFAIQIRRGTPVGYITFRAGESRHILLAAGHIGYRVDKEFQGHGYAYQACMALAPFMRTVYDRVIITTNLTNIASIRTIERLGAAFLGVVEIPPDDPAFASGDMRRRRYEWVLP